MKTDSLFKNNIKTFFFTSIVVLATILRLFILALDPPSLNWDEASLGYNAYAVASTGYDEHGEFLPIARFIAFGDYKPPGYIYLTVLPIRMFGLNEFSIRLTSAIAGILLVVVTFYLSKLLFQSWMPALLSTFSLALSPWSIQLSRAAVEANVGTLLNSIGVLLFILGIKRNSRYLPVSIVSFVLSFYTFNANRVIAPLLILALFIIYYKKLVEMKRIVLFTIFLGFIMVSPTFSYFKARESRLRFQEVSIFTDISVIKKANERISREHNALWSKVINNRRALFAHEFLKHFADNFNMRYLFLSGDKNPRLSIQTVGELFLYELPFLLFGLYILAMKRKKILNLLVIWVVLAIIPAATARETPHALRTASVLPVYQLIIGYGFFSLWMLVKRMSRMKQILSMSFIVLIAALSWYYYLHYYYIHYPKDWAGEWQYGYKQMVKAVDKQSHQFDKVVVTKHLGRPYIYFLLYNKVNPLDYLRTRSADRDWWGLWEVKGFDKYYFGSVDKNSLSGKTLFVNNPTEVSSNEKILQKIKSQDGKEIFVISKSI